MVRRDPPDLIQIKVSSSQSMNLDDPNFPAQLGLPSIFVPAMLMGPRDHYQIGHATLILINAGAYAA